MGDDIAMDFQSQLSMPATFEGNHSQIVVKDSATFVLQVGSTVSHPAISPAAVGTRTTHARTKILRQECLKPSQLYIHRTKIEDYMSSFLFKSKKGQTRFVLHGLGGSGKSQLTSSFINENFHGLELQNRRFSWVCWIDASDDESIKLSLQRFAQSANTNSTARECLKWLSTRKAAERNWIMVFDGADDPALNLFKYFPHCQHGKIIITTRNYHATRYGSGQGSSYCVSEMIDAEAVDLLLKYAYPDPDADSLYSGHHSPSSPSLNENIHLPANHNPGMVTLVKQLGCFPLSITQAGIYMYTTSPETYLDMLHRSPVQLGHDVSQMVNRDGYEYGSIEDSWSTSHDKLGKYSRHLLHLIAWMNPTDIQQELFKNLFGIERYESQYKPLISKDEAGAIEALKDLRHHLSPNGRWDADRFRKLPEELESFSFISSTSEKGTYSTHHLVQGWAKCICDAEDKSRQQTMLLLATSIRLSRNGDAGGVGFAEQLAGHVDQVVNGAPLVFAGCHNEFAHIYEEIGKRNEATKHWDAYKKGCLTTLENNHPDFIRLIKSLAERYREEGRTDEHERGRQEITKLQQRHEEEKEDLQRMKAVAMARNDELTTEHETLVRKLSEEHEHQISVERKSAEEDRTTERERGREEMSRLQQRYEEKIVEVKKTEAAAIARNAELTAEHERLVRQLSQEHELQASIERERAEEERAAEHKRGQEEMTRLQQRYEERIMELKKTEAAAIARNAEMAAEHERLVRQLSKKHELQVSMERQRAEEYRREWESGLVEEHRKALEESGREKAWECEQVRAEEANKAAKEMARIQQEHREVVADLKRSMGDKHQEDMAVLKREAEAAASRNEELRFRLAEEHQTAIEEMERTANNKAKSQEIRIQELQNQLVKSEDGRVSERKRAEKIEREKTANELAQKTERRKQHEEIANLKRAMEQTAADHSAPVKRMEDERILQETKIRELEVKLEPQKAQVIIAIMGATGTGKSTFTKYVTGDESIIIGHIRSQTSDVQTYSYVDPDSGATILVVDTPGFDDLREGVTDTDILERIGKFLRDNGGRKFDGILYMHRISDVRMGGVSRRNLKMFKALCGDDGLKNVRIVTTNWDRVQGAEGKHREADLAGPDGFEKLIAGGAKMVRQDNGVSSARLIISELIPNEPVLMEIAKEMKNGKSLGETSAGNVVAEDLKQLQQRHEEGVAELRMEMKAATEENRALLADLLKKRRESEKKMERAAEDARRLQETRVQELELLLAQEKDHSQRKGFFLW